VNRAIERVGDERKRWITARIFILGWRSGEGEWRSSRWDECWDGGVAIALSSTEMGEPRRERSGWRNRLRSSISWVSDVTKYDGKGTEMGENL
jgi:hypothetical protein